MQFELLDKPDFTILRVLFDAPGEQVLAEPSAMVARDTAVQLQTELTGGAMAAMKRKLLAGGTMFLNTFTGTAPGQSLWIAPGPEGDIEMLQCDGAAPVFLSSGAFLASAPTVRLDANWGGAKGLFSGTGTFLLKAEGHGALFLCAYGGIHTVDVGQYPSGYVVDTQHIVAWTGGLDYKVRSVGGLKSLFLSGEGLVCEFRGTGRLWISTRNPGSLAAFLQAFRRVGGRGASGS